MRAALVERATTRQRFRERVRGHRPAAPLSRPRRTVGSPAGATTSGVRDRSAHACCSTSRLALVFHEIDLTIPEGRRLTTVVALSAFPPAGCFAWSTMLCTYRCLSLNPSRDDAAPACGVNCGRAGCSSYDADTRRRDRRRCHRDGAPHRSENDWCHV